MEYKESEGVLGTPVGKRVKSAVSGGRDKLNLGQGPLQGGEVGDRVRNLRDKGPNVFSQDGDVMPDEPGPNVAGRTPLVGSLRRSNDIPVLRDRLSDVMD